MGNTHRAQYMVVILEQLLTIREKANETYDLHGRFPARGGCFFSNRFGESGAQTKTTTLKA